MKSLQIKNFQCWRDVTLNFSPGINWIVGSSDTGKSALMRALRWLHYGRPAGFSFRSWWAEGTKETTRVDGIYRDGNKVSRFRSNTENKYSVNGEEFLAGTEVPETAATVMDVSDINLQQQGDRPFLLDLPAPEVARYLNAIANLSVIDESHTRIHSKLRACDSETLACKHLIEQTEGQLKRFEALEKVAATADMAATAESGIRQLQQKKTALEKLNTTLLQLNATMAVFSKAGKLDDKNVRSRAEPVRILAVECGTLERLIGSLDELTRTANVLAPVAEIAGISHGLLDAYKEKEKQHGTLAALVRALERCQRDSDTIGTELEELKKRRTDLIPDVCPLCGAMKK